MKTKQNYLPWNIQIQNFPNNVSIEKQLKFLVGFAILAPSGHNSQPWLYKIKDNSFELLVNHDHSLSQSDPLGRQLFISYGCFIENLLIAADYFGLKTQIEYHLTEYEKDRNHSVLKIFFERIGDIKKDDKHLIFSITQRRSNRYKYKDTQLENNMFQKLINLSTDRLKIFIVTEKTRKDELANIIERAQIQSMEARNFREELSNYLKSNFTSEKFGMPGFTLDMPAFISTIASKMVRRLNLSKLTEKKDLKLLVQNTQALGFICGKEDDYINWIEAGKMLEKLWLILTQNNFAISIWAAGVQVPEFSKKIQDQLNTDLKPLAIFRLGIPIKQPNHSPRFNVKDLIKT